MVDPQSFHRSIPTIFWKKIAWVAYLISLTQVELDVDSQSHHPRSQSPPSKRIFCDVKSNFLWGPGRLIFLQFTSVNLHSISDINLHIINFIFLALLKIQKMVLF
jgi:hypothetical protein